MKELTTAAIVDQTIRARRTTKAFADEPCDSGCETSNLVRELIEVAGHAPFHRRVSNVHVNGSALTSPVPWRFYVLDEHNCRAVRARLLERNDESKIPRMLAVASAVIQVTWLPNPAKEESEVVFEPTIANMEHIAAASAAVQNLLLAATARDVPTYWSSGGALRNEEAFRWLRIPAREILLGSVFLFPADLSGAEVVGGNLRDQRGESVDWARWVGPLMD